MTTEQQAPTQFDYLLNAMELAAQNVRPALAGYGAKRHDLFEHVRKLEQDSADLNAARLETKGLREAIGECDEWLMSLAAAAHMPTDSINAQRRKLAAAL